MHGSSRSRVNCSRSSKKVAVQDFFMRIIYNQARFSSQISSMRKFIFIVSALGIFSWSLQSCYYDVGEELYPSITCDTTLYSYTGKISAIISQNCLPCHGTSQLSGGIDLTTYSNVANSTSTGNLLCSIRHSGSCSAMPKDAGQLDACSIKLIELWSQNGYPEN